MIGISRSSGANNRPVEMVAMTESELRAFFDAYRVAVTKMAADMAPIYHAPCMTARQGVVRLNTTPEEVTAFFGAVLQQYQAQGITLGDLRTFLWVPRVPIQSRRRSRGTTRIPPIACSGRGRLPTTSTAVPTGGRFWCKPCTTLCRDQIGDARDVAS